MLISMTGFGKIQAQINDKLINIEIQSLNSKHLDLNIKSNYFFNSLDSEFRKLITSKINRGKIDLRINYKNNTETLPTKINTKILNNYINQLKKIDYDNKENLLSIAMKLPEVINSENINVSPFEKKEILTQINNVINDLSKYQLNEGKVHEKEFKKRIKILNKLLKTAEKIDPFRIKKIKKKIKNSLSKTTISIDTNRFEQELIYYLEKNDITEEKVRLKNNLNYFLDVLNEESPNGKKLSFITQEIGREINTIGSKANDSELQKIIVQMKDELEKIKEQLHNIA